MWTSHSLDNGIIQQNPHQCKEVLNIFHKKHILFIYYSYKENNFESKIRELEVIVKELESGEVNLDDAIDKYTKAMKLAKECSDKLNKATDKVNKILKENGVLEEFKVEE